MNWTQLELDALQGGRLCGYIITFGVSASFTSSKPTCGSLYKCNQVEHKFLKTLPKFFLPYCLGLDHHSSPSVLPDSNAGSGKFNPGQYDGELHQHLPAGGHAGTVEGTKDVCATSLHTFSAALNTFTFPLLALFLHQGVSLTAQRAAIVVGVELPAYDITKKHLILSGYMGDTVYTHFL